LLFQKNLKRSFTPFTGRRESCKLARVYNEKKRVLFPPCDAGSLKAVLRFATEIVWKHSWSSSVIRKHLKHRFHLPVPFHLNLWPELPAQAALNWHAIRAVHAWQVAEKSLFVVRQARQEQKVSLFSTHRAFALSLSKGERGVFQQSVRTTSWNGTGLESLQPIPF